MPSCGAGERLIWQDRDLRTTDLKQVLVYASLLDLHVAAITYALDEMATGEWNAYLRR